MARKRRVQNGKCRKCKIIYSWRVRVEGFSRKALLLRDAHCPECSEKLVRCSKSDYDELKFVVMKPLHHDFVVERIGI